MTRLAIHDIALPDDRAELTDEERVWMTFLRDLYGGPVRSPTLRAVQALRANLDARKLGGCTQTQHASQ